MVWGREVLHEGRESWEFVVRSSEKKSEVLQRVIVLFAYVLKVLGYYFETALMQVLLCISHTFSCEYSFGRGLFPLAPFLFFLFSIRNKAVSIPFSRPVVLIIILYWFFIGWCFPRSIYSTEAHFKGASGPLFFCIQNKAFCILFILWSEWEYNLLSSHSPYLLIQWNRGCFYFPVF